jgi:hypothetical protein
MSDADRMSDSPELEVASFWRESDYAREAYQSDP